MVGFCHIKDAIALVVSAIAPIHKQTDVVPDQLPLISHRHGGNRQERAEALGCKPQQLLDLSASLVPSSNTFMI